MNPLSPPLPGYSALSGLALASIELASEADAQLFWTWANADRIRMYGHTLRATPDPSGFRVFGEVREAHYSIKMTVVQAVAANFRNEDLNTSKVSVEQLLD